MRRTVAAWLLRLSDRVEAVAYRLDDRAWVHRWAR